ncbi:MAG: PepSY-associated TM helix domain-containing protein [Candidatus Pseudobacter hemicellulosilyticus]|uniref:PepSY-associated TM helix domain-containing protein n=1 Tax=Candidatus Pseudobacter hemicellulosilyticus TaxID=3121375 RepID=A0AAJ5WRX2_9BACT|nr:MAG: PepSY-associated TM helix domain-containing protein [Pseudobacter sp.]
MAQERKQKRSAWQQIRKLFNDIHLWLGLASGLIVIAVCFSGTVYVYSTELTELATPHLFKVDAPAGAMRIPADSMLRTVAETSGGAITSVQVPADPERTYQYNVKLKDDNSRFGTTYFVHPYTGAILGTSKEKNGAKEFMSTMFSLHRWLLLDKVEKEIITGTANRKLGSMITGWATILFTLGCITGLVIWFPQKVKFWRQGLKIKWAGWKRINHDLHNTLAFYSLIFLLLMGLTGPQWSFEWYRTGLQKTLGVYKEPKPDEGRGGEGGGRRGEGQPGGAMGRNEQRPESGRPGERRGGELDSSVGEQKGNGVKREDSRKEGGAAASGGQQRKELGTNQGKAVAGIRGVKDSSEGKSASREGQQAGRGERLEQAGGQGAERGGREGQRPAGGGREQQPKSVIPEGTQWTKPGINEYIKAANQTLVYNGNYTLMLPADSTAVVNISKTKVGFFAPAAADRVILDQYSTKVLKKEIFTEKPFNERVAGSIKAIHVGNVYGGFTKLLYFLACLIATSLPITGTMIWLNKMKKKKPRGGAGQNKVKGLRTNDAPVSPAV